MLNRSCETCRLKKLRCQGGAPCQLCRETSSECTRVARKKKTMRRRSTLASSSSLSPPPPSTLSTTELALLAQSQVPLLFTSPTFDDVINSTALPPFIADDILPPPLPPPLLPPIADYDQQWLCEANDTIFFCHEACQVLLSMSFRWRVLPSIHGCIDVDVLLSYSKTLSAAAVRTATPPVGGPTITRDQAALLLLSLSLALVFTPPNSRHADPLRTALSLSPLRAGGRKKIDPRACQRAMYTHAMGWLSTRHHAPEAGSLEAVQCVVLATLHGFEDAATLEALFDRAVRWSMQLNLHRVRAGSSARNEEVAVRTWWFLVTRDWLAAPRHWTYTLHRTQFITRLPAQVDLDGLQHSWTPASYSIALIALANTVRRLVDRRNERCINTLQRRGSRHRRSFRDDIVAAFDELLDTLPQMYAPKSIAQSQSSSSSEEQMPLAYALRISVERWLLYPQILHCFLALHDADELSQYRLPPSYVALAHCTLCVFERSFGQCSVLAASELPVRTLTLAATVICIDALNRGHSSGAASERLHDFVKVSVAAGLARRLVEGDRVPTSLLHLERLIDVWRRDMPTTVASTQLASSWAAIASTPPSSSSSLYDSSEQVQQYIYSTVDDILVQADARPASQLWGSNETWDPALRWDDAVSASTDAIPVLAATLPAFQVDRHNDTAWWSKSMLSSRPVECESDLLAAEMGDTAMLDEYDVTRQRRHSSSATSSNDDVVPLPDHDTMKRASQIAFQNFQFMHLFHPDRFFERIALQHDDHRYPHASVLHAILALAYAASPTLSRKDDGRRVDAHAGAHYDHFLAAQHHIRQSIAHSMAPGNSLDVVRATLLLVLKSYGQGDDLDAFILSAQAMRTCVIANMNRESVERIDGDRSEAPLTSPRLSIANRSSLRPRTYDAIEAEEVRRTMLFAFAVDRTSSLATLWPSTLSEDDYKAELPRATLTQFLQTTSANIDAQTWPACPNPVSIKSPALMLEPSKDVTQFIFKNFVLYGRCAEFVSRLSDAETVETITLDHTFQQLESYVAVLHLESLNVVPLLLGQSPPVACTSQMFIADATKSAMRKLALLGASILPHICTLTLYEPIANLHADSAERCRSATTAIVEHLCTCEQYAPAVFDLLDIPVTIGITMTGRTLIRQLERTYFKFIAQQLGGVDLEEHTSVSPSTSAGGSSSGGGIGDLTDMISQLQAQLHVVLSCLKRMSKKWHVADKMHESLLTLLDFHPEHHYRGIFFAGFLPAVTKQADHRHVREEL